LLARYILPIFSIFILLGRIITRDWARDSIAFLSTLFYAISAMHFTRRWWAF